MLRFARISQFVGVKFWIVLSIVITMLSDITCVLQFVARQFIRFFWQVLLISEWHLHIFDFESQESNRTKILRKLLCSRLQIRVEGVKGEKGTFSYPPDFFLSLVFENPSQALLNIQLWLLDLTLMHFYRPDIANARRRYFLVHAVTSKSDCWIDFIALYFINFH